MALALFTPAADLTTPEQEATQAVTVYYQSAVARDALRAKYEEVLQQHQELMALRDQIKEAEDTAKLHEEMAKTAVKKIKKSVRYAELEMQFKDPMTRVIDGARLCELFVEAREVPGLICTTVTVDAAVFDAAVAANVIPDAVAKEVSKKVATTSAGSVTPKWR